MEKVLESIIKSPLKANALIYGSNHMYCPKCDKLRIINKVRITEEGTIYYPGFKSKRIVHQHIWFGDETPEYEVTNQYYNQFNVNPKDAEDVIQTERDKFAAISGFHRYCNVYLLGYFCSKCGAFYRTNYKGSTVLYGIKEQQNRLIPYSTGVKVKGNIVTLFVKYKFFYITYTKEGKECIHSDIAIDNMKINMETGQSYMLPSRVCHNGKWRNRLGNSIYNISLLSHNIYCPFGISFTKDQLQLVLDSMAEYKDLPWLSKCPVNDIETLIILNRAPHLASIIARTDDVLYQKRDLYILKGTNCHMSVNEFWSAIGKKFKFPISTGFVKSLDLRKLANLHNYEGTDFKDINYMRKAIELYCCYVSNSMAHKNTFVRFINNVIALRGEKYALSYIDSNDLEDILYMVELYYSRGLSIDKYIADITPRECHDLLSHDYLYIRTQNSVINYTAKELKLQNNSVRLAPDTNILIDIHHEMHICVNTYADRAISKQSYILYVKDNDEYVACIEINNNTINQIKGKYNGPIQSRKAILQINSWIAEHKFTFSSMGERDLYDYCNINNNIEELSV